MFKKVFDKKRQTTKNISRFMRFESLEQRQMLTALPLHPPDGLFVVTKHYFGTAGDEGTLCWAISEANDHDNFMSEDIIEFHNDVFDVNDPNSLYVIIDDETIPDITEGVKITGMDPGGTGLREVNIVCTDDQFACFNVNLSGGVITESDVTFENLNFYCTDVIGHAISIENTYSGNINISNCEIYGGDNNIVNGVSIASTVDESIQVTIEDSSIHDVYFYGVNCESSTVRLTLQIRLYMAIGQAFIVLMLLQ